MRGRRTHPGSVLAAAAQTMPISQEARCLLVRIDVGDGRVVVEEVTRGEVSRMKFSVGLPVE